jgi:glycerol-3-phosphate dehydrogenase (NAD(P)+)
MTRISILGAGSWGTALAVQLAKKHPITLWEFDPTQVEAIRKDRENRKFLPGVPLPYNVTIFNTMEDVIPHAEVLIFAVPSRFLSATAQQAGKFDLSGKHLVSLVKGLEKGTHRRMTELIAAASARYASLSALSGPSHAEEVAQNIPTAVILASADSGAEPLIEDLSTDTFRLYFSSDTAGVELCAAVKNVIAIAAGICDGLGLGANTKSALLTRGMEEIRRLIAVMGADERTVSGLSGIGDLITTCISGHSRNRHVGEELGRGRNLPDILGSMVMVAEGVDASSAVLELSRAKNIEMPITEAVCRVLFEGSVPAEEVKRLMSRPYKREFE